MSADSSVKPSRKGRAPTPTGEDGGTRSRTGPWPVFFFATLAAASAGAVSVGATSPANVVFVALAICAAGAAAFALHRTVWPLVAPDAGPAPEMLGGRTRAALEREKTLVLRAIKELEFDRAMGKVSEADFQDMGGKLRARAIRLIRQLDIGSAGYRELIEREVSARRQAGGRAQEAGAGLNVLVQPPAAQAAAPSMCARCGTVNDSDAKFCKQCGNQLLSSN